MNVDVLVDWARESLLALERPQAMRKVGLDVRQVEAKLGWLRKFAVPLRRWGAMLAVIGEAEHYVRHEGMHAAAAQELAALLPKSAIPAVQRLRKQLLEFVERKGNRHGKANGCWVLAKSWSRSSASSSMWPERAAATA